MLISHWSLTFHSNGHQHHRGLGLSFPKWYDTCIFIEKWPHNRFLLSRSKPGELRFRSKFWQNFRGLFGALKTLFWCKQRYGWMPPYWYSRFLMSKTNLGNLILRIPYSGPKAEHVGQEMSHAKSDRTSDDLVWKIVESIKWDWNVASVVLIHGYTLGSISWG